MGRIDEARAYFQEAIRLTTKLKYRPELALTRFQLSELLFEHYPDENDEARVHLNFALNEFEEMKMAPSLEKAQELKEKIGL